MPLVGFEPTIPVFEMAKTVHALDRAATAIGSFIPYPLQCVIHYYHLTIRRHIFCATDGFVKLINNKTVSLKLLSFFWICPSSTCYEVPCIWRRGSFGKRADNYNPTGFPHRLIVFNGTECGVEYWRGAQLVDSNDFDAIIIIIPLQPLHSPSLWCLARVFRVPRSVRCEVTGQVTKWKLRVLQQLTVSGRQ
jgi:hypothetical protein